MVIGVPKETHHHEHRVGLNPFAIARLLKKGHTVFVESRAGEGSRFSLVLPQDGSGNAPP